MSSVRSSFRWSTFLMLLCLVGSVPLLSGCLQRSTNVGDRYSGTVIVATSPDNPRGAPKLDIPQSMASRITLRDYSSAPASASPGAGGAAPSAAPGAGAQAAPARVGTEASFSELTAGQFGQLGDIVASSFGDSAMSMDLTSTRSGDVVRFRGSADLTDLNPTRDLVELTVTFDGPITAQNGNQIGDRTVTWTPESGKTAMFSADATYPDPATAAVSSWSWFLALVCLITVAIVARLAYVKRDRSPRPGRPRYPAKSDSEEGTDAEGSSTSGERADTPTDTATGAAGTDTAATDTSATDTATAAGTGKS
ncbi:LppM family (lipo)protein [Gordonia sp. NPDC003424]